MGDATPVEIEVPDGDFAVTFTRKRRYTLRVIVLTNEPVDLFSAPVYAPENYVRTDTDLGRVVQVLEHRPDGWLCVHRDPKRELWMRA